VDFYVQTLARSAEALLAELLPFLAPLASSR
jgi:hypothetical protein